MPPNSSKSTKSTKRALANAEPVHSARVRVSRRAASGVQASTTTPASGAVLNLKQANTSPAYGRLPSAKIDTNLRSHDRRDPFGAINTLIKLMGSLPSRVIASKGGGGCQYKLLSIEEHNLSMHLCNIIEPSILSYLTRDDNQHLPLNAASANHNSMLPRPKIMLMRQPTEILDKIASFINTREDLMTFGLTCSRLSEIVFPRHWEYRVIKAKISMIGVWKHLYERVDLAANVRVVEIMDERNDACSSSANDDGNAHHTDGNGTTLRRGFIHKRQEKYFVAALARFTRLAKIKWESNHSPFSIVDDGTIWRTLADTCGKSLESLVVFDNMAFSPMDDEGDEVEHESKVTLTGSALVNLRSITIQAPQASYGTPRTPSLTRTASVLHQCPNIQNLEIRFKNSHTLMPVANEFLTCGRWSQLTSLTLSNLSCFTTTTQNPLQAFLAAHSNLESLKILDVGPSPQLRRLRTTPRNMLPKLRELHANRDVINMILRAECDEARPLESIKGFKLIGAGYSLGPLSGTGKHLNSQDLFNVSHANLEFYRNLRKVGASVKRVEVEGWGDLDDVRMLAKCVPGLTWLDVGRRLRSTRQNQAYIPVTSMVEWAEALSGFEELTTFHGVRFFYEISSNALPNNNFSSTNDTSTTGPNSASYNTPSILNTDTAILMTDRSRIRKNDEIAGVLTWKCAKLRRVDHWEGTPGSNGGKIIVLFRDSDYGTGVEGSAKIRWDVRRVRT
ncbi:hypothetical protein AGABI1DRAFT_63077 [Agaricus bisporus var. burnettii JB137-S8]|uniref:F-box domain-containing protein n=1 Tax=Agaricus bisporus var. burnettii (strain JB137-S8 / ATCC MYA-4627 / FGSC 10392) TaxID=597362 RepID=K5VPJ8_AGABU|nr:uncharacterized protein AGABI1DRAFT_63077 [Agaricus bisporus var. burnettii JB137-S8]EKM76399.1 hypothetical protein AGABI1DRAFT_63077 [Agaricus bisporus var. burnettii JB137-S8]